jgi:hypothetical protein
MPTIIVQAHAPGGTAGALTFVERALPVDLHDPHYTAQLVERIGWALDDAERLEANAIPQPAGQERIAPPSLADPSSQLTGRQLPDQTQP